ncbi:Na(+)/H(+) exchange regulatory cofactor NHE-RF3 [Stegastes partitus]|uniref:Na(+)/H(+) exchange regulatory cofactor NHE-RF3 n=1 Tax=Stegastes partitus TaxID=144197 RepID=A0A3B5B1U9_9TELE|nr:PREDICTED: Na(+)/H(+) exchange regulatory cofactor NHE-RF3 [Stegastes partitus]
MAGYKPRVISLSKRPGQTFGFYLRVEHGQEGHLIRCLEMGGPAELAGMKDGDRILRVNGTFVDALPHSAVVEMVRESGASVTFHLLDESSYKNAKAQGVDFSDLQSPAIANGVAKQDPKPKLCFMVKSSSGFEFSLRSVKGENGMFMTAVTPGNVAYKAGVRVQDRLLEINGENIEHCTHEQVVAKMKQAGSSVMLLLVDEETDKFFQKKRAKIGTWLATTKYLPKQPRIINITEGSDGYGFLLREEPKVTGHFIKDIDRGSPAERAGLKEMDRLVAVDGKEVDSCSHEMVVEMFKKSGNKCCLLVVDRDTDKMYKMGKVSPMLFWEDMKDSHSPPSYTEAITLPTGGVQQPKHNHENEEELKPKLCKLEKTSGTFGFHLNGIQGVSGQYITEVVTGGAADRAGLENNDIVVEINGVNVEQRSYADAVEMIKKSGNSLEMLVARKSVYDKLRAKGVTITTLLLEETSYVQVHTADSPKTSHRAIREEEEERTRSVTPERLRATSVTSNASELSLDERF